MRKDAIVLEALLGCAFYFAGCGGNTSMPPTNPPLSVQPNIISISPTSVAAGSGGFTLTITGTGLGMGTQVNFGGAALTPSSATPANCPGGNCVALAVPVPAQDVSTAGTMTVSAANAPQVSNAVAFAVTPQSGSVSGSPQLLVFVPMVAPAGGIPVELVVEAENVAQGAIVNFGSIPLTPSNTSTIFYPG